MQQNINDVLGPGPGLFIPCMVDAKFLIVTVHLIGRVQVHLIAQTTLTFNCVC